MNDRLLDDVRYSTVLAIARAGSPSAAALATGGQATTLYRQIEAIETAVGSPLFLRDRRGWTPTPLGRHLIEIAVELARRMNDFSLSASAFESRKRGLLRVTLSDAFSGFYLAQRLPGFVEANPGFTVELIVTNRRLDLSKGEADIAIRPHSQPGDGLVGRRAGKMLHALFASEAYLRGRQVPTSIDDLSRHHLLAYGDDIGDFDAARWTADMPYKQNIIGRFSDVTSIARAVEGGLGVAFLPIFVGAQLKATRRLWQAGDGLPTDIWLLCHSSQRRNLKATAFIRHFAKTIKRDAHLFSAGSYM